MKFDNSFKIVEKAKKFVPSLSQTFSKSPSQFVYGSSPLYLDRGQGSHVWDVDNNEYIDYICGLGPVTLGYNYPRVNNAISEQLKKGITFSLPNPLEVEVAELLTEVIPCAEMARYGKNGSDATAAAVRASRAFTKKDKVAVCGYHGWQDWYIGSTTRDKGVPKETKSLTLTFEYNNIESLKKLFEENKDEIACVIMEPLSTIEPENNFLQEVKKITKENNAILIFDEIVTGFRFALGGAQELYKVTPDLATFGKGMGNGMPISVVTGKSEIMEIFDEVFFSFTFGGECLSLAATKATIEEMRERDVIKHLWSQGKKLKDGFNDVAKENELEDKLECFGLDPRTVINFKNDESNLMKSVFQQELIKKGILSGSYHNLCYSHSDEDIEKTLNAYKEVIPIVKKGLEENKLKELVEGKPIEDIFRKI